MNQNNTQPPDKPQHLRVVVLDDEECIREYIEMLIHSMYQGIEIAAFADGDDAWAELLRQTPDLLITDYEHPGMRCAELFARLAGLRKACPVILATGYQEMPAINPGLGLQVTFLAKPYGLAEVQAVLARPLGPPTLSTPF